MEFNDPSPRSEPVIAKRSMDVESHSRCFCIWNCRCHCIQKVETLNDINVCHRMGYLAERDAGLLLNCPSSIDSEDVYPIDINNDGCPNNPPDYNRIFGIIFIILLVVMLLGKHLIQFRLFLTSLTRHKISLDKPKYQKLSSYIYPITNSSILSFARSNFKHPKVMRPIYSYGCIGKTKENN